jgi:acyl carrier protein
MTWTREAVHSELMKVFEQHAANSVTLTDGSHLVADLGIDSLGVMEVIGDLEDVFKLTISDDALREIGTIGDVMKAVEARLHVDGRLRE